MVERQPPNDEGSRGNLKDRKATVKDVAKGYVGIINIYQLIPKGGIAVPAAAMGVPPAAPGTKLYPQGNQPTGALGINPTKIKKGGKGGRKSNLLKAHEQEQKKMMAQGQTHVAWSVNSTERKPRLAVFVGDVVDHFLLSAKDYSQEAATKYNAELERNKSLINDFENIGDSQANATEKYLKIAETQGKEAFDRMLLKQAMNLQIPTYELLAVYQEAKVRALANQKANEEAQAKKIQQMGEKPQESSFKLIAPRKIETFAELNNIEKASPTNLRYIGNHLENYDVLSEISVKNVPKENLRFLKYAIGRNDVPQYYLDTKSAFEAKRRRRLSKTKVKRKIIHQAPKKKIMPKSSMRKKQILKKLKCVCKKRRY